MNHDLTPHSVMKAAPDVVRTGFQHLFVHVEDIGSVRIDEEIVDEVLLSEPVHVPRDVDRVDNPAQVMKNNPIAKRDLDFPRDEIVVRDVNVHRFGFGRRRP